MTLVTIDARSHGSGFTSDVRSKIHDVFSPLQTATHDALRPIGNFLSGAVDYGSLKAENQRLRDQLANQQQQSIQAAAEEAEAQQITQLQDLPFVPSIPKVTVAVIDNGSSNFENTVTVNKGSSSGIAAGQPVVAAGGLVGSVQSVSSKTATIVLLTDPTFAVGVRLDSANVGTALGSGRGEPMHVTVDTPSKPPPVLTKGQPVLTSGLTYEKFPPNIPVGKVASYSSAPGASEPDITIQPFVNVSQLAFLDVLIWSQP